MTLPIPDLDDRNFNDLMTEALSLIPRYNREWTNFNASDPGITLLELLAWFSESVLYTANTIPEETTWQYIDLIGLGRKEKTLFSRELSAGDMLIADGRMGLVAEICADDRLTLVRAFDQDIERPETILGLSPGMCPQQAVINGKAVENVDTAFWAGIKPGHILVAAGRETGVVKKITGPDKLEMFYPFSSKIAGPQDVGVLKTQKQQGGVRARGRHLMGENTAFNDLLPGDVIVAGGRIKVVSLLKDDLALTVSDHFLEDINDSVDFYAIRPKAITGTMVSSATIVSGNKEDEDFEAAMLRTVKYVTGRYRAVTTDDYETLIGRELGDILGDMDFRIACKNNRNFEWGGIGIERPGHITAIIIAAFENSYLAGGESKQTVREDLEAVAALVRIFVQVFIPQITVEESVAAVEKAAEDAVESAMPDGFDKAVESGCSLVVGEAIRRCFADSGVIIDELSLQSVIEEADKKAQQGALPEIIRKIAVRAANFELLERIEVFMDKRRILTTRVHAVFPKFRKIMVDATLQAVKGVAGKKVRAEAQQALLDFVDPIGGGDEGTGRPLGRNLYRSEVYQALEGVRSVDHVLKVAINGSVETRVVRLEEDELIDLQYTVTVREV